MACNHEKGVYHVRGESGFRCVDCKEDVVPRDNCWKCGSIWRWNSTIGPELVCKDCEAVWRIKPPPIEEFRERLFNDPVAYTYFHMGRAVERDSRLTPEQRARKNWDAVLSAIQSGYERKIMPDVWTAEYITKDGYEAS